MVRIALFYPRVYKVAVDQDMYYVKLTGPLRPADMEPSQAKTCQLASVCLKTPGTLKSLGSYTSIAYYMEGQIFLYTSNVYLKQLNIQY